MRNPAAEGCQEVEVAREPVFVPVLECGYALVPVRESVFGPAPVLEPGLALVPDLASGSVPATYE